MSADQFMGAIVRNTVHRCQRYTVTASRQNRAMETIGERVRSAREEKRISRRDLAAAADMSPTALSDLELGRSKRTTHLHQLAKRLDAHVAWLETGRGPKWLTESEVREDTTVYNIVPRDEETLLRTYRAMTPANRAAWLTIGRELARKPK